MDRYDHSTDYEGEDMAQKIIFFDVDGTLYRRDCLVPEGTVRAIHELEKNGHLTMVCTGRGACTLPQEVEALPLHGGVRGCGTYVAIEDRVLTDAGIEGPAVFKIIEIMRRYDCPFFVENSDFFYSDPTTMPDTFKNIIKIMSSKYGGKYKELSELPNKISKMTAYPSDRQRIPALIEELSPWFDVITHDEYDYIEIVTKGCSKGTGVQQIIAELGVSIEDTYGFGDSGNDIPMLEAVGTAVVMGNAPAELKAKYITTDSIYEDGLVNALIKLGLI